MDYRKVQYFTLFLVLILFASIYSQTEWQTYNASNSGLPDNYVNDITIVGGTKWFGTTVGVGSFDGTNWEAYNTLNSGLTDNYILAIDIDEVGDLWVGSLLGDLVRLSQNTWTVFNESVTGVPMTGIAAIATARDMNVKLFGGSGLIHLNIGSWELYNSSNSGLPNDNVYAIAIESSTGWWIGTDEGLARFDGSWTVYSTLNSELPGDHINAIAVEESGVKWICTNYGVARFDDQNWTVYTSANSGLPEDIVYDVAIDDNNNKWFATFGNSGGLAKFDDTNWMVYNISNTGVWNYLLSVAVDSYGNIWTGSNGFGTTVFNEHGLSAVSTEDAGQLTYALVQNYPNPFNPATTISYKINRPSFVSLKVYDMLGNEISALVNEEKPAGEYKVDFDASGLASGIYLYKISAGEFTAVRKMTLLK